MKPTPRQQQTLDRMPLYINQWWRVDERVRRGLLTKKLVKVQGDQVVRTDLPRYRSIDDK
jgi:hypothetical protein